MSNNVWIVYNRLDENSLVAAGVVKRFSRFQIVEYEQVEKASIQNTDTVYWMGFQPIVELAKVLPGKHIAFLGYSNEKQVHPNIELATGNFDSVTEQVILLVLVPMMDEDAVTRDLMIPWIGYGHLVSLFCKPETPHQVVTIGYNIIEMIFNYLYYHKPWKQEPSFGDNVYENTVKECKHFMSRHVASSVFLHDGKLKTRQLVNLNDYRWFVIKRLTLLFGQVFAAPRIVGGIVRYETNESIKLKAA